MLLASLPEWAQIVERLGISTGLLIGAGLILWRVISFMLPTWKKKAEAQNELTIALTSELPKIASNTERVAGNTEKLFESSLDHNRNMNSRIDGLENDIKAIGQTKAT